MNDQRQLYFWTAILAVNQVKTMKNRVITAQRNFIVGA
jgi:hypothetical protein